MSIKHQDSIITCDQCGKSPLPGYFDYRWHSGRSLDVMTLGYQVENHYCTLDCMVASFARRLKTPPIDKSNEPAP
jgi:hypothetical protein